MVNYKSHRVWLFISYLLLLINNSFFTFIAHKSLWKYDKIVHFSEYFILGFLLFHVLYEKPSKIKEFLYSIIVISFLPIIDETIQLYSYIFGPSRIASVYDAIADYIGCYSGCFVYYLLNKARYG